MTVLQGFRRDIKEETHLWAQVQARRIRLMLKWAWLLVRMVASVPRQVWTLARMRGYDKEQYLDILTAAAKWRDAGGDVSNLTWRERVLLQRAAERAGVEL